MATAGPETLGLIAGIGTFPLDIARSARRRGRNVVAVAFHRHTDPRIEAAVSAVTADELAAAESLAAEKYATDEWTRRR